MPGSDTTTLIITGDSSGAVAALKALGIAYQEAATSTEKGKKSQQGFNEMTIPGKRDIRELSFAAFELSGSMGTLGPIAQQARAGLNILSMATQGTAGPIGIAIAAIGMMVYALTELVTATGKAETASLKMSAGLAEEGKYLSAHAELLKSELAYRYSLLEAKRGEAEAHLKEAQNRTLLQNLMRGGLNVYGYELSALERVTGTHITGRWAAAKYHEEIDKGLKELAGYGKELDKTAQGVEGLAASWAIATALLLTKPKEKGVEKKTPEEEALWRQIMARQEMEKEAAKRSVEIEKQAREDSLLFNQEYDKMLLDQEALKYEALQTLRLNDSEAERAALERKALALAKYSGDALAAAAWLDKQRRKIDEDVQKREFAMNITRVKAALHVATALAGAANFNAEQEIRAQMLIAGVRAIVATAEGLFALGKHEYASAANFFASAIEFAGVAAGSYRASVGGGGGGEMPGEMGGGGVGPAQGGTYAATTPSGPITNYFYSSVVVNGNVIGLDDFFNVLDEWWIKHVRSSGGDINRG
jgi:hypothetical protein